MIMVSCSQEKEKRLLYYRLLATKMLVGRWASPNDWAQFTDLNVAHKL